MVILLKKSEKEVVREPTMDPNNFDEDEYVVLPSVKNTYAAASKIFAL